MKHVLRLAFILVAIAGAHQLGVASGRPATDESLYVVTHVDVMPKFTAAGRDLLQQFAAESRKDDGAVRIEVYEELSRPNHSTVVEVWKDQRAFDAHVEAEHTRTFRGKLQPMLGSPLDERLHRLTSGGADR